MQNRHFLFKMWYQTFFSFCLNKKKKCQAECPKQSYLLVGAKSRNSVLTVILLHKSFFQNK